MLKAAELEYEECGEGEPVLLIHGGAICDFDLPLMSQPALAGYRLIRYHRRGFAGSTPHSSPPSIADQARDGLDLLRALGIHRANIVGHSHSGAIALQLALDTPAAVHSLVLREPALFNFLPNAEASIHGSERATELAATGDHVGAVDFLMSRVGGENWRAEVARTLRGAPEQVDRDAPLLALLYPSIHAWHFDARMARRISQPVLSMVGTESGPLAGSVRQLLHSWLPKTEDYDVPGANHLLQLHSPRSAALVAEGIASFLKRHPFH